MKKLFAATAVIALSVLFFTGCKKAEKKSAAGTGSEETGSRLTRAHRINSNSNLKQIATMLYIFEADNGRFPADLSELNLPGDLLTAPYDKKSKNGKSSYIYLPGRIKVTALRAPGKFPAVIEDPRRLPELSTTLSVLFVDGHVESLNVSKVNESSPLDIAELLISRMDNSDKEQFAAVIRKNAGK